MHPTSFSTAWLVSGRGHLPGLVPNLADVEGTADSGVGSTGTKADFNAGTKANSSDFQNSWLSIVNG